MLYNRCDKVPSRLQFRDVLLLEEDLPHVRAAAKVCVEQLERDVASLRSGLREVARELEWHAGRAASAHDAFVPVMRDFHAHAVCSFTQLEDLFQVGISLEVERRAGRESVTA